MDRPDIRPVPEVAADAPAPAARRDLVGRVEAGATIIGRRDIAIVPWLTIAMVSVAVAISTILRPTQSISEPLVIGAALAYAVLAGALAALQDHPIFVTLRRSVTIYVAGSVLLVGLLAAVGALDRGLDTVYFTPIVQVAAYLGLVLPTRWARGALVVLLGVVAGVHAAAPDASTLDAITLGGLVVSSWLVGVLIHAAHGRAAGIALLLSRSDVLTGCLNRRGFFDQFDNEIDGARMRGLPMALLLVDLDDFKLVNDREGHAAGDELLRWVGEAIPTVLPEAAALGRLGGDEFGVLLPGLRRPEAEAIATAIVAVLAPRTAACVGVASSDDPSTTADDYLRVADAAMYACKESDTAQVQCLVAGSTRATIPEAHHARPPALTYARLRAVGGPPDKPASGIHFGWLLRGSFWVVATSGGLFVAGEAISGPQNAWGDLLLVMGAPWVIANLVLGWIYFDERSATARRIVVARTLASMLVGGGVAIASLAHGGITTPIIAALYLKVLFDASVLPRGQARSTALITVAWWAFVVVFGPRDSLWAVPYELTLFAVSFVLGVVGRRAFTDATSQRLRIAHTDALTGLRNRPGFMQGAQRAFDAARGEGRGFAVIAFDLDDFKVVNDTHGHAAGDELLQTIATITKDTLPSAYSVGRLGGDEFVAAVPAASVEEAAALAAALSARIGTVAKASIGAAVHPADGDDLEALMQSADHRSYSAKPGRTRHSPLTALDDDGTAVA